MSLVKCSAFIIIHFVVVTVKKVTRRVLPLFFSSNFIPEMKSCALVLNNDFILYIWLCQISSSFNQAASIVLISGIQLSLDCLMTRESTSWRPSFQCFKVFKFSSSIFSTYEKMCGITMVFNSSWKPLFHIEVPTAEEDGGKEEGKRLRGGGDSTIFDDDLMKNFWFRNYWLQLGPDPYAAPDGGWGWVVMIARSRKTSTKTK